MNGIGTLNEKREEQIKWRSFEKVCHSLMENKQNDTQRRRGAT